MSTIPRAGDKRPSDECNDGDSAVPFKVELGPASSSRSAMGSRNSRPEPTSKTGDVTSLYTAAEIEAQLERKAKQCAVEFEGKILELESKHANEKAHVLGKALQDSRRHGEETARLNAVIESLQAKLKEMQEAEAVAASVKKEVVSVVDEQAIRQEMEQRYAAEKQAAERRFDEAKHEMEQENASMKELLASSREAATSLTKQVNQLTAKTAKAESEKADIERTFAEAKQKAEQEIALMKKKLESQSESIMTLTNNVHDLTAKATKAEGETMEARQHSWQYYAHVEAMQKEIEVLRAAPHALPAPAAPHAIATSPSPSAAGVMPSANQIYVGKLTPAMTEDVLRQYFSKSGHVTRVVVKRHLDLSGYAFIHFSTPAEVLHALSWNGHAINGQNVVVGPIRT